MPLNRLMTFAEKLTILMDESPLSQTELGKRVGVHQTQISRWMKGEGSPSLVQAAKIAESLDVTIDFLGKDDMDDPSEYGLSPEELLILKVVRQVGPVDVLARLVTVEARKDNLPPIVAPTSAAVHTSKYWKGIASSSRREPISESKPDRSDPIADQTSAKP